MSSYCAFIEIKMKLKYACKPDLPHAPVASSQMLLGERMVRINYKCACVGLLISLKNT